MATDHGHENQKDTSGSYVDITTFGNFHGTSSHTGHDDLHGGRTAITTEALVAYNGLRGFLGFEDLDIVTIGQWAFDNDLTNNDQAWGQDLEGVGLYYAMQGAKVGWIRDDAFDPQLIADIQRTVRLGDPADVMAMVEANSHDGFADYLTRNDLVDTFINTLKMEPHYGGWMHGRVHGGLTFPDGQGARAHDVNHLTVLSHDQTQPFMNDTFDWPQWSALDVPHQDVIDYFQSMVVLGDPLGDALPSGATPDPVDPTPVDPTPDPVDPDPVEPDPVDPAPVDPASGLSAEFLVANDWGHGATLNIVVTNNGTDDVTDWDLEFTLGSDIQHIWNAVIEDQSGNRFTIDDAGWNANIGAGESVTVGFNTTSGSFDVVQLNDDAQFLF
ncbi:cellulose binding domain-containing protein [uncultured Roseibium sp.]|uniref:cellulose binding domain-containing protein n=1 Tax=uncultured Roseibium sp. TaxID=1936171 RepID=UPI00263292A8|nr:cellulose binding domain-containing protein [uncultured Roseibium sp.]